MFRITRDLGRSSVATVERELLQFCARFMPDHQMQSRLVDEDLYRNLAVQRLLVEVEQDRRASTGVPLLDLAALAALGKGKLTVEHVLPQDAGNSFDVGMYGFIDAADYDLMKHRLGNLLLLEGDINSACNNHSVEAKIRQPGMFPASMLCAVQAFAAPVRAAGGSLRQGRIAAAVGGHRGACPAKLAAVSRRKRARHSFIHGVGSVPELDHPDVRSPLAPMPRFFTLSDTPTA